jgi:hypothetical protein
LGVVLDLDKYIFPWSICFFWGEGGGQLRLVILGAGKHGRFCMMHTEDAKMHEGEHGNYLQIRKTAMHNPLTRQTVRVVNLQFSHTRTSVMPCIMRSDH